MTNVCLETERMRLKVLDESYAHKVLEFYKRNAEFLAKWEPIRDPVFYSLLFQEKQLRDELTRIQSGQLFKVWLFKKEDIHFNEIMGSIALNEIVRGCFQSCFLGYKLSEENVNYGYMSEAISRIIDYAFNELNLHRIEANIIPHNLASKRVVEKNGFQAEGLSPKYLKINGVWEDHIHMVLLNDKMI